MRISKLLIFNYCGQNCVVSQVTDLICLIRYYSRYDTYLSKRSITKKFYRRQKEHSDWCKLTIRFHPNLSLKRDSCIITGSTHCMGMSRSDTIVYLSCPTNQFCLHCLQRKRHIECSIFVRLYVALFVQHKALQPLWGFYSG